MTRSAERRRCSLGPSVKAQEAALERLLARRKKQLTRAATPSEAHQEEMPLANPKSKQ